MGKGIAVINLLSSLLVRLFIVHEKHEKNCVLPLGDGFIKLIKMISAPIISVIATIPVAGFALIPGIDRFMREARALTNPVGNGVAAVVAAK